MWLQNYPPAVRSSYRRIYLAQFISEIGDWGGRIALLVFVQRQTGSTLLAGLVLTIMAATSVAGGWIGSLADRLPPRLLMMATDFVRAGCFVVVALLPMGRWFVVPDLVLVVLAAAAAVVFEATRSKYQNQLGQYDHAAADGTNVSLVAQVASFAIGGALVGVIGPRPVLWLNAASFVASAMVLRMLPRQPHQASSRRGNGWWLIWNDPVILVVAATVAVSMGVASVYEQYVPLIVEHGFGLHSWLLAVLPVVCVGATVAANLVWKRPSDVSLGLLLRAGAGSLAALSLLALLPLRSGVALVLYGAVGVVFSVSVIAKRLVGTRQIEDFGALIAALQASFYGTTSAMMGITSILIGWLGVIAAFRLIAVAALGGVLAIWLTSRRLADHPEDFRPTGRINPRAATPAAVSVRK